MARADSLLQRALAGDRDALGFVWREHRRWIAVILLAHAPRGADLDDLLQDVASRVVERLSTLRDPERLRPWLRAIAVHTATSAGRGARVRSLTRSLDDGQLEIADRAIPPPSEEPEILRRVNALPADYREALLLQAVRGLSQREIAQTLDVPETTVESRLARARRMLRAAHLEQPT